MTQKLAAALKFAKLGHSGCRAMMGEVPVMSAQTTARLTPEEYLTIERGAEFKSEYFQGRMWPLGGTPHGMAGGRPAHNLIASNLLGELYSTLKGCCLVFNSDQRVRVAGGLYTYPDVSVVCGKPVYAHGDLLTNPNVLIEVLSSTTEAEDRGFKFAQYRLIESLEEYILVSQSEPSMERYRRQTDGSWNLTETVGIDAVLKLESTRCEIALAAVYANVEFSPIT